MFYIAGVNYTGTPGGGLKHAVAYTKSINQTGNNAGENFIVINTLPVQGNDPCPFLLGHEVMHILLDSEHRNAPGSPIDPDTSLFAKKGSTSSNTVVGSKRIGPNLDTKPADKAGHTDTFDIREIVETLP